MLKFGEILRVRGYQWPGSSVSACAHSAAACTSVC